MTGMYERLFQPGSIGSLRLPNRIIKSPQTSATANPDGTVTERTVNHYRRLGQGGPGLVMVEYTYVDDDASKSIHGQTGISRRDHVAGLGWLADEVRATGARIGLQLVHAGRQKFLGTAPIKSASASSWDYVEAQYGVIPAPMTVEEIHGVVIAFGEAAARAYAARFDLVEIHAGHGYMLTNFLSPFTNDRTDEYGGSAENRARVLVEVVDAVRERVPRDFPLSVRLSVTDYEPSGIELAETVELCRRLEERGVDVIHASGGHHALQQWEVSSWYMPRQPHRWGWEQIKRAVGIPVIASGSLLNPAIAEEVLTSGGADFVSLGRPMLADPDWANKARAGRALEITPCIRCNDGCLERGLDQGRSVGCSVNPEVAEEGRLPLGRAADPKRVAVLGGGPSGLRAAAALSDRGHEVTLFEPGRLGGMLDHARGYAVKQDLADLVGHLVHEVRRRSISVVAEAATAHTVRSGGFDTAVIATGAPQRAFRGPIDSAARVLRPEQTSEHRAEISGRVAIVGGGFQGCETALRLAELPDVQVTVFERGDALLTGDEVKYDLFVLPQRLTEAGVTVKLAHEVTAIGADGITVSAQCGSAEALTADWVIVALGREASDSTMQDELESAGIETVAIGSARRPGRVFDAIHDAYFQSRLI